MVKLYPNTTVTMVKNMLLGHNNVTIKNAKSLAWTLVTQFLPTYMLNPSYNILCIINILFIQISIMHFMKLHLNTSSI